MEHACLICGESLGESEHPAHFECVPEHELIMLCNCGERFRFSGKHLEVVAGYLNESLAAQKSEIVLKTVGGIFIIVSECFECEADPDDDNFQIIYVYDRRTDYN